MGVFSFGGLGGFVLVVGAFEWADFSVLVINVGRLDGLCLKSSAWPPEFFFFEIGRYSALIPERNIMPYLANYALEKYGDPPSIMACVFTAPITQTRESILAKPFSVRFLRITDFICRKKSRRSMMPFGRSGNL